jgi:hypothetical protein
MVTDTGRVAEAIDAAQARWPGLPRAKAIPLLLSAGAEKITEEKDAHTRAVQALSQFSGLFPPGYLADLRSEWPQ